MSLPMLPSGRQALLVSLVLVPGFAGAQTSPFMTGMTSLQSNLLAWLTPVAIILVMVLGTMAMASRLGQVVNTYGSGEAQTIIENCSNSLILRCSSSQHGGTAAFASRLIGQREVIRSSRSFSLRPGDWFESSTRAEHQVIEPAVLDSEIEQLPDRSGYLKLSSMPQWRRVQLPVAMSRRAGAGVTADAVDTAGLAGITAEGSDTASAVAAARTAWQQRRVGGGRAAVVARLERPDSGRERTPEQPHGR